MLWWVAGYMPASSLELNLPPEQKKVRTEIATWEAGCWYMSVLDSRLVHHKHVDRNHIINTFMATFGRVALPLLKTDHDTAIMLTAKRVLEYKNSEKNQNITEMTKLLSAQITSGFEAGCPTQLVQSYGKTESIEEIPAAEFIKNSLGVIDDSFEKFFLKPLAFK
jgi:hypothetical protein